MPVLPLLLEGPMQAWGTQSRFTERDSGIEPSKSGVIGMICSAMARPRGADISDLAGLRMGVRVDREGTPERDYHTVLGVPRADGSGEEATLPSNRYYLADPCFVVFLEGEERILSEVSLAFRDPKWLPFLGRKSFPPSSPIESGIGIQDGTVESCIRLVPWLGRASDRQWTPKIRTVTDCAPEEGEPRFDVPLSFLDRKYGQRYVKTDWIALSDLPGV